MTGATWGEDDMITFGTQSKGGLRQIPAGGGASKSLTTLDEARKESNHEQPELLPGGKAVLFTIRHLGGALDKAQIAVRHLGTGEQRVLVSGGSYPKYVPSGHIVYAFAGTLRAVPFDLDTLTVTGNPVGVLERVSILASGAADVAVARDGSLVYATGNQAGAPPRTLVWVDRQGREEAIPAPVRTYQHPRLSPDGTKVALDIRDQELDIWVWDFTRTTFTRLTFDPRLDGVPVWTPDGKRIAFASDQSGTRNLFWRAADGTGPVERLSEGENQSPLSFSPDGTRLVLFNNGDLAVLNLSGDRQTTPLFKTASWEPNAEVSPDGRWLAYQSNESGEMAIYVRPFPEVEAGRWQVSTGGGSGPRWARSGKELFYLGNEGAVMRVGVAGETTFRADTPTQLFRGPYFRRAEFRTYDVSPDGKRFLMIKEGNPDEVAAPPSLILVQNWFEELKRLVPTKR
jgi:serine/threonine-protein kinase